MPVIPSSAPPGAGAPGLLLGLGLLLLVGACEPGSPLKPACRDDQDCNGGRVCVDGTCAAPSGAAGAGGNAGGAAGNVGGGGGDAGTSVGGAGGTLDGDAGVRTPAPANCDDSNWDPLTLTSTDQVRALVVGRWVKCGGGEPVNLESPFELADDGNWYSLVRQSDGTLARSTAFGKHGVYEIKSPTRLVAGAESNVAFSLDPFIMNFGPALYTVAR